MSTKVLTPSEQLDSVCEIAVHKWGEDAQIYMLIEECGELLQVLMHDYRGRAKLDDIHSEIADVLIMCWQMRFIYGSDAVDKKLQEKLNRIEQRQFSKK